MFDDQTVANSENIGAGVGGSARGGSKSCVEEDEVSFGYGANHLPI